MSLLFTDTPCIFVMKLTALLYAAKKMYSSMPFLLRTISKQLFVHIFLWQPDYYVKQLLAPIGMKLNTNFPNQTWEASAMNNACNCTAVSKYMKLLVFNLNRVRWQWWCVSC